MTAALDARQLERFRGIIATRLGLLFEESKLGFLSDVLRRRLESTTLDPDTYLSRLDSQPARDEVGALGRELTVSETYFLRNIEQFRAFTDIVLPERLAARASGRRLRILSLGCASGEEAYSVALLVRDRLGDAARDLSVVGVDVSSTMIEKARRGRFSSWALRQTPEHDRQRWFRADGGEFVLDEGLRASVRFEQRNLVEDDSRFWEDAAWDVVFCRNVIMYFVPEQTEALIGRIARGLCPGGYLFLGHAETLRGLSSDFHLRHTHGTFYYQRKDPAAQVRADSTGSSDTRPVPIVSLTSAMAEADTWVDAIRRASERVATLTDARSIERPGGSKAARVAPAWDLGMALELLRKERFGEALSLVDALPPETGRDPDVLLLHAVLLAHGGQLAEAEGACTRLLAFDDLSAGAHYLLALCREGAGDRAAACHHNQVAAYLDPGFAMPRLQLGLLARRAGDRVTARRELGHALVLLQREDASRVLLFGGGFGREALLALCQAEFVKSGGNA
jgi:chemotaxis protein methyltransferase CheR